MLLVCALVCIASSFPNKDNNSISIKKGLPIDNDQRKKKTGMLLLSSTTLSSCTRQGPIQEFYNMNWLATAHVQFPIYTKDQVKVGG